MRVLITAGPVYGRIDDNKIVSNRVRGIWATRFAGYLSAKGHHVTLVLPDTMPSNIDIDLGDYSNGIPIRIRRHNGFEEYRAICNQEATAHDAAVLAAAVVNWIPAYPIKGKMSTEGYQTGDIINIPFVLAPRVIQDMKAANPNLTLIGCKMLIGSTHEDLISAAYEGVLLPARCNAVVANDVEAGLRTKHLVYKDRSVQTFTNDFKGFFHALLGIITDLHWSTKWVPNSDHAHLDEARATFDQVVNTYRDRFVPFKGGRVFGAVAVRIKGGGWLVSPREKGDHFTSRDATIVHSLDFALREVAVVEGNPRASLNAPLLIGYGVVFAIDEVVHLHEQIPGLATLPHGPPGTDRDNVRILGPEHRDGFNIEGHGCILPVKEIHT
jgi:hypothetical protein